MNKPKTIREALANLSEAQYCGWDTLAQCFVASSNWMGPSDYDEFNRRFKRHWVVSWMCTDTQVGLSIITLDNEAIAVSCQSARKSDEDVRFLSADIAARVLQVMDGMANKWEDRLLFVDLDEEIDASWYARAEYMDKA